MMRMIAAMVVALGLAGCFGNRMGGEGNTLTVTVQNDGAIPSQVRVYLVQSAGPEINLGTLPTLGTGTLSTTREFLSGQYRLRAEGGTNAVQFSPVVALAPGDVIIWNLQRNVIQRP
ncbi:hypothetical protein [Longimicrobium sp.]|uniref:hypothetical protein n=1 Tax=Longimicrobium sp. TaxID=2029185 RepID=UPI002E2EFC3A|nr:hypothetical protein [Longimicrobium sp.]HEX6036867.1 hypothetical protein [Longimicrobium sp.]